MKIKLVCIATRKYTQYIQQFLESAKKYFFPDDDVNVVIFTDNPEATAFWQTGPEARSFSITDVEIPAYGFPDATLLRYHIFSEHSMYLQGSDYVFYCDIDSRFVDYVGKDDTLSKFIANPFNVPTHKYFLTCHPGFWQGGGSWEERLESLCCAVQHRAGYYVAGGFLGARTLDFLNLSDVCSALIRGDSRKGITAKWHDESALNKFISCVDMSNNYLPPEYVWPQDCDWFKPDPKWKPRILALKKDHEAIRS